MFTNALFTYAILLLLVCIGANAFTVDIELSAISIDKHINQNITINGIELSLLTEVKTIQDNIERISHLTSYGSSEKQNKLKVVEESKPANIDNNNNSTNTRRLSAFTCESFTGFSPFSLCSDVVDYPFHVDSSSSKALMETAVRATIPLSTIGFINNLCLSDYKRVMCASIYRPCVTNVVSGDTSTYDQTTNLPYKGACKSLCDAASSTGSTCSGVLEGLGMSLGCSNYETNVATCNAMTSSSSGVYVANHKEPYIGTVCAGVITETYLGATSMITDIPGLSPLLPPYVQQSLIELTTAPIFAATPKFFTESCQLDGRKIFCALKYPRPQALNSLSHIFGGDIYMPQLPSQEICMNYGTSCVVLKALNIKPLQMDCTTLVAPNTPLFPETSVTLGAFPVPGSSPIFLTTNAMTITTKPHVKLVAECPNGYTTDFDKDDQYSDKYVWMLNIPALSECKQTCPSLLVGPLEDYVSHHRGQLVSNFFNLLFSIITVINMNTHDPEKRNNYVYSLCWFSCAKGLLTILPIILKGSFTNMSCENGQKMYDGSVVDFVSLFTIPCAFVRSFGIYAVQLTAFCVTLEVWARVVWKIKNIKNLRRAWTVALVTLYISIFIISIAISNKMPDGKDQVNYYYINNFLSQLPFSVQNFGSTEQWKYIHLPLIVLWAISSSITFHMFFYCISISLGAMRSTEEHPLAKLWKTYSTLISLALALQLMQWVLVCGGIMYEHLDTTFDATEVKPKTIAYATCLISSFVSRAKDPTGGLAKCGERPDLENPWGVKNIIIVFLPFVHLLLIYATHTAKAGNMYWNYFPEGVRKFLNENYYSKSVLPGSASDKAKDLESASGVVEMKKPQNKYTPVNDEETKETH